MALSARSYPLLTLPNWLERTLDTLIFLVVLGVTVVGTVLVANAAIHAVWGKEAGLGLVVVLFSAVPISLIIALVFAHRRLAHWPLAYRHLVFVFVSLVSAAVLAPLVLAIIHGP